MVRRAAAALGAMAIVVSAWAGVQAQAQNPGPTTSSIIQKVIVKVNGEIFTQNELEREQIGALQERAKRRLTPADLNDTALQAALGEVTPTILVEVIDELLMVQRGRELGAKFSEKYMQSALDQIKKTNNMDDATLQKALAQEGMTMEELRQNIERRFYIQHVQSTEIPISLTESEARAYYKAHPEEFMKPATVTVRELFIAAPDGTEEAQQAALAKLKAATDRAAKGEDFAKIVGEVSESASKSAPSPGLIENVTVDVINPDFRAAIEKIQTGGLTQPIKTEAGFVVFKLEARTAPEPLPFEEVVNQITQKIGEERMDEATAKHIEKLRAQAIIEWKDDGYRQMYERHLAERSKTGL